MTCNIERPTPEALFLEHQNMFQTTVLGGGTIIPESNEWYAMSMQYAVAEKFYAITEQSWKELDPRTACCDNLVTMAARDGVLPTAATPAQGYLKLDGTPLAVLPTPLSFLVGGLEFVTASGVSQPLSLDDAGSAVIRVRASIPGDSGNITEATGTMTTAVANVNSIVEVCGGSFCNGADTEECEALRIRYMKRKQYQPRATMSWIQAKLLEWPCATRAILRGGSCCECGCSDQAAVLGSANTGCEDCGCIECGGKMHFYVMFDNSFANGIPTNSVIKEIETWMFGEIQGYGTGQVEMGVCGRIVPINPVPVDVIVNIHDCPTASQLASVQTVVDEFFTTVEPSQPVSSNDLSATLSRTLGSIDIDVRLELTTSTDGYGTVYGPRNDLSKVYSTGCSLEPDCDYMLVQNTLTVTRINDSSSGCPS